MRRLVLVLALAALVAFTGRPARAQVFFDCNAPAFADEIRNDLLPGFECVEMERLMIGALGVRIIRDQRTAVIDLGPYGEWVKEAIARALDAWGAIRPIRVAQLSVILPPPDLAYTAAIGPYRGVADSNLTGLGECRVVLNLHRLSTIAGLRMREDLTFVMAHELAHCVQFWNFRDGALPNWASEGSADHLAALVYPNAFAARRRYPGFLRTIATVPLQEQSYAASVFFHWLHAQSPVRVFDLLDKLAGRSGTAEVSALLMQLGGGMQAGHQALGRFAQAVVDNSIRTPSGGLVGELPKPVVEAVTNSGERQLAGRPFTIQHKQLSFRDGRFTALTLGDDTGFGARVAADSKAEWGDLPTPIGDGACGETAFDVAHMPINAAPLRITVARTGGCDRAFALSNAGVLDDCVAGDWRIDRVAHAAQLGALLGTAGKADSVEGEFRFRFGAAGKASMQAAGFRAQARSVGDAVISIEANGEDTGAWSAGGGMLEYASNGGQLTYAITVRASGMEMAGPQLAAFHNGTYTYGCTGEVLELVFTGPDAPPGTAVRHRLLRAGTGGG